MVGSELPDGRGGGGGAVTAVEPRQAPSPAPAPPFRRRLPRWARSAVVVAVGVAILTLTAMLTGQFQLTSGGTAQAAVLLMLPILLAAAWAAVLGPARRG